MSSPVQVEPVTVSGAGKAARKAAEAILRLQGRDGSWSAVRDAGCGPTADFLLARHWLNATEENPVLADRLAASILDHQLTDGGFSAWPGGPVDLDVSARAYAALTLRGHSPSSATRARILEMGGLDATEGLTVWMLAIVGCYPREECPPVPVELALFSRKSLDRMPGWTQAVTLSIALLETLAPKRPIPHGLDPNELRTGSARPGDARRDGWGSGAVRVLHHVVNWLGLSGIRRWAVREAETRLIPLLPGLTHLPGGYLPMLLSLMALDALGYGPERPERAALERQVEALIHHSGGSCFPQPDSRDVRDTAAALTVLVASGVPETVRLQRTLGWLLRACSEVEAALPAEDAAAALLALNSFQAADAEGDAQVSRRLVDDLLARQAPSGGWSQLGVSAERAASFGPAMDLPSPDVTGRVIEALCRSGIAGSKPSLRRAVAYLVDEQALDGSWPGPWGGAHIYGVLCSLRGLRAAGEDNHEPHVLRAGEWLRSVQNADGGWGEAAQATRAGEFVRAASSPTQTAWALTGLLDTGDADSDSVQNGIRFLLGSQSEDGGWPENAPTLTAIPDRLYQRHSLDCIHYPLETLLRYLRRHDTNRGSNA